MDIWDNAYIYPPGSIVEHEQHGLFTVLWYDAFENFYVIKGDKGRWKVTPNQIRKASYLDYGNEGID